MQHLGLLIRAGSRICKKEGPSAQMGGGGEIG